MVKLLLLCYKATQIRLAAHRLRSSLHKLYGRHHNLVNRNKRSIYQMTMDLLFFYVDVFFPLSLPILLSEWTVDMSNTMGVL